MHDKCKVNLLLICCNNPSDSQPWIVTHLRAVTMPMLSSLLVSWVSVHLLYKVIPNYPQLCMWTNLFGFHSIESFRSAKDSHLNHAAEHIKNIKNIHFRQRGFIFFHHVKKMNGARSSCIRHPFPLPFSFHCWLTQRSAILVCVEHDPMMYVGRQCQINELLSWTEHSWKMKDAAECALISCFLAQVE